MDSPTQGDKIASTPFVPPVTLEQLLALVTPENRHPEQEMGAEVGLEVLNTSQPSQASIRISGQAISQF